VSLSDKLVVLCVSMIAAITVVAPAIQAQEAGKLGVEVADSEVEEEYARMARRMNQTAEQLTTNLTRSNVNVDTIKHRIRADMVRQRQEQLQRCCSPD
jgi:hypothetical protein